MVELETRPVLKQCVLARAALAALKPAAALIPNQQMLINTIPLLEAARRSRTSSPPPTGCSSSPTPMAAGPTAFVRERLPKVYSRELVDVIFEQPYCRIANLVEIGVLQERQAGKEKLFIHPRLMQLLADRGNHPGIDQFAANASVARISRSRIPGSL